MSAIGSLKNVLKAIRRRLGLSAMGRTVRQIEARGFKLAQARALELYGRAGDLHTLEYADKVKSLEIWELDPIYREPLAKNLPKARVKIVDTYEEIQRTPDTFDLIVSDNPTFIHGGHCENFDLFPTVYRAAADRAVLVINVIPRIDEAAIAQFSNLAHADQQAIRAKFYECDDPTDVPIERIEAAYRRHAEASGFRVDWTFLSPRGKTAVKYFVQQVTRVARP